jgi:ubiquinone biosynthesis monooxygenase Coq7
MEKGACARAWMRTRKKTMMRRLTRLDAVLTVIDQMIRPGPRHEAIPPRTGIRELVPQEILTPAERQCSAQLLRVDHAGEVCAQGLYHGQAVMAKEVPWREALLGAAHEEQRHLQWCAERLRELDASPSVLVPFWYGSSLALGVFVGLLGDGPSKAFLRETEDQVVDHLEGHLDRLSPHDTASRHILQRMAREEAGHSATAARLGGRKPAWGVRLAMWTMARLMTTTSARL